MHIYTSIYLFIHVYTCVYIHTYRHTRTYISAQNKNWGHAFFFAKVEKPSWKCNKTQMTGTEWGEISLKFH